jgi:micrococcal nuclease
MDFSRQSTTCQLIKTFYSHTNIIAPKMGSSCCKEESISKSEPLLSQSSNIEQLMLTTDLESVKKREIIQGRYKARVKDIYDGDTVTVVVSLDGKTLESLVIRVYGMDCPELKGATKKAGQEAKEEVLRFIKAEGVIGLPLRGKTRDWFNKNPVFITLEFVPIKEKFGRYLTRVFIDGKNMAEHLIGKGLAKAYDGGTKDQEEWMETSN